MSNLRPGDRIRILTSGLDMALVYEGDVLTVQEVGDGTFETDTPTLKNYPATWMFALVDEGTGWEKVTG